MLDSIWQWFFNLKIENKLTVVSLALMAITGIVISLFVHCHNPDISSARKKIFCDAKELYHLQKKEKLFFHESVDLRKKFYKKMSIMKTDSPVKSLIPPIHLYKSYLITGEAGCGKSAVLQNAFQRTYRLQRLIRFSIEEETYAILRQKI